MEKKSKPVAPLGERVKNRIIKIITFFTCIVLISVNLFIFSFSTYGIGYKYYENNIVQIGTTQQEDLMKKTIDTYLAELGENGYYIYSTEPDKEIVYKKAIIKKDEVNDNKLEQIIKDSLHVNIFAVKLSIENEDGIYYFKSEDECNKFINNLKEYNDEITTIVTNEIIELNKITDDKVIQDKIEEYRLDRESRDAEAAAQRQKQEQEQLAIASRSGGNRVNNYTGSFTHPLDSYTYISSYFGYRSRGFHTGVDFATPTGTEVHA